LINIEEELAKRYYFQPDRTPKENSLDFILSFFPADLYAAKVADGGYYEQKNTNNNRL